METRRKKSSDISQRLEKIERFLEHKFPEVFCEHEWEDVVGTLPMRKCKKCYLLEKYEESNKEANS